MRRSGIEKALGREQLLPAALVLDAAPFIFSLENEDKSRLNERK